MFKSKLKSFINKLFIIDSRKKQSINYEQLCEKRDEYSKYLNSQTICSNPKSKLCVVNSFLLYYKRYIDTNKIDQLNDQMVIDFINDSINNKKWEKTTANTRLGELKKFLSYCKYEYNGIKSIKRTISKRPNPGISKEDYYKFCTEHDSLCPKQFAVRFITATGIRRLEYTKLTKNCFTADLTSVSVHGKNGKSRNMRIPCFFVPYLKKYLASIEEDKGKLYPFSYYYLTKFSKKITEEFFKRELTPQDLRVVCLQTVKNVSNDESARYQAGHSRVETTRKYYTHEIPNTKWDIALTKQIKKSEQKQMSLGI